MRNFLTILSTFFCLFALSYSSRIQAQSVVSKLPFNSSIIEKIKKHDVYVQSQVTTFKGDGSKIKGDAQRLNFKIAGLHKKSCTRATSILSKYENFKNHIDFLKESRYDESKKEIYLLLSHRMMPFDMSLAFKIPRITGPGIYPFSFENGFLKGLTGLITVLEENQFCLFLTEANWEGPHSSIPSPIFELFSATLSRLSMEKLFKISGSY